MSGTWALVASVCASLTASVIFLVLLTRVRPRVEISAKVARSVRNGQLSHGVKIINRSRADLVDIRVRLDRIEITPDVNGYLKVRTPIPLRFDEILVLPRFKRKDKEHEYAYRFTTTEDVAGRMDEAISILRFQLVAKHSVSGFSRAFSQNFRVSDIVDGNFAVGNTFEIALLASGERTALGRLLAVAGGQPNGRVNPLDVEVRSPQNTTTPPTLQPINKVD